MTYQPANRQQAEDSISCAVCLAHFEDPRILPCQHSYCLKCLQRLVRKTDFDPENPLVGDEIVCPRCRKVAYLGDRGVDGLPRNVDLNYAVEVIKPMLAPSPIIPGGPELGSQLAPLCDAHRKRLEYYCRLPGCTLPICGDCHVLYHQRHDVCKLEDAVNDNMASLRTNVLDKADVALLNVTVGIMEVERMIDVLNERKNEVTEQIHARFQRILDAFHAREQQLIGLTEKVVSEKIRNLKEQLDVLQQTKKELTQHTDSLKAAISTPEAILFLGQKRNITDNVTNAVQKAQDKKRKPCESVEDGPHYFIPESLEQMAQEVGGVYCKPVPSRFTAQGESLTKAFVGKEARFTVKAYDQFGQRSYVKGMNLKVAIEGPNGTIAPTITEDSSSSSGGSSPIGQYVVSFVPHAVGLHTMVVTVNGIPITPAVFKLVVFKSRDYHSMDKPINIITKSKLSPDIANVRGLSVTLNDQVVFTDGFYMRVLDENCSLQSTYGGYGNARGQLNLPLAVAVTKSKPYSMYVSDSGNHRIQKITLTGTFQSTFGEQGNQPGQFNSPEGIAVLSSDKIYVADRGNHRIQVFRQSNNKLAHVFGKLGTKPGELNSPRDVAIDLPLNRLLVADSGNNRIQAFTLEGAVLSQPGFRENTVQLDYPPCRIACDPDSFILVSHMKAFVSVLTPRGELIRYLGTKNGELLRCLQSSYGICVNSKGEVLISDGSNHSIVIF